jgi:DNA-directed RNA polymerase subunit M/transcription elongation factor TFIIS
MQAARAEDKPDRIQRRVITQCHCGSEEIIYQRHYRRQADEAAFLTGRCLQCHHVWELPL